MHPFLVHRRWLALYLLFFLQAGVVLAEILLGTEKSLRGSLWTLLLPLLLLHAFSCLASWYLCRAIPLGKVGIGGVLAAQAGSGLLASTALVGVGWVAGPYLGAPVARLFHQGVVLVLVFAFFLYSLMVVLHYLFLALETSTKAEAAALEARILAREAELQSLRTQLDPHFLFNCLNSISALVTTDPKQAREMCGRLALFFRRTLDLGAQELVPLSAEVELARDYLAIEEARFGDRLRYELKVGPGASDRWMPPLILQPLLENAVRHGIGHLLEGGEIGVEVSWQREGLILRVENPCDPDRPRSRGAGVGLANVRQRLQAIYGAKSKVRVRDGGDRFEVVVRVPGQISALAEPRTQLAAAVGPDSRHLHESRKSHEQE